MEWSMSTRPICALAGLLVMACAPAFPARPELPPIAPAAAEASNVEMIQGSAPMIPMPDLSNVQVETQDAGTRPAGAAQRTVPAKPAR
jgi:hypothetical protein